MPKDGKRGESRRDPGVHQSTDKTYHFGPGTKVYPTKEGGYKVKPPKEK